MANISLAGHFEPLSGGSGVQINVKNASLKPKKYVICEVGCMGGLVGCPS